MVDAISQTGVSEGELILNKRDRDKVGKKIIERLNGKLTLSKENIDAKGGFVLRQGSVEINSTLERMVDSIKEEVTPEIVETLF
jgi:vacuolar-type H+-ATPase subunit E/Vma4